jgi:hypothetical protein
LGKNKEYEMPMTIDEQEIGAVILALTGDPPCNIEIQYNPHALCYETIKEYEAGLEPDQFEWLNDEARADAISKNQLWIVDVYPHTPIGSYCLAGPELGPLLKCINGWLRRHGGC